MRVAMRGATLSAAPRPATYGAAVQPIGSPPLNGSVPLTSVQVRKPVGLGVGELLAEVADAVGQRQRRDRDGAQDAERLAVAVQERRCRSRPGCPG